MSAGGALWAPEVSLVNYLGDSLFCAPRAANTSCPHEAPFGRLWSPLINLKGDNISKYVCPTIIIDIARKITKFVNFYNFDA